MLVDAEKAKAKLAKLCEENVRSWSLDAIAGFIRAADLSDCAVRIMDHDPNAYINEDTGAVIGPVSEKGIFFGNLNSPWKTIQSLSAQVAELKKAIVAMAEAGWLSYGPERMSDAQKICYTAYLAIDAAKEEK